MSTPNNNLLNTIILASINRLGNIQLQLIASPTSKKLEISPSPNIQRHVGSMLLCVCSLLKNLSDAYILQCQIHQISKVKLTFFNLFVLF